MQRSVAFALSWILCAGAVGALLGAAAAVLMSVTAGAGIIVWALSGAAVGAAQWTVVCRRLQVSKWGWVAATALGSLPVMYVYFYLGVLVTKGAANFSDLLARYGDEVALYTLAVMLVGGVSLGLPQAMLLRETGIRWWNWPLATILGILGAWLGDLGLWDAMLGRWPRPIGIIIHMSGYWMALSLPQAVAIGAAMRGPRGSENFMPERVQPPAEKRESF
jgi:hypothetical protein